jgi:hypothetical protein
MSWEQKPVEHILAEAAFRKPTWVQVFDTAVYWIVLLSTILGNFVLSVILVPLLLTFTGVWLAIILVILGLLFGVLMHIIIKEIQHLKKSHYFVFEIFIPVLALINIYIITRLSNLLAPRMGITIQHNPWLVSVLYVMAFSLPHIISRMKKHSKPL